MLDTECSLYRW